MAHARRGGLLASALVTWALLGGDTASAKEKSESRIRGKEASRLKSRVEEDEGHGVDTDARPRVPPRMISLNKDDQEKKELQDTDEVREEAGEEAEEAGEEDEDRGPIQDLDANEATPDGDRPKVKSAGVPSASKAATTGDLDRNEESTMNGGGEDALDADEQGEEEEEGRVQDKNQTDGHMPPTKKFRKHTDDRGSAPKMSRNRPRDSLQDQRREGVSSGSGEALDGRQRQRRRQRRQRQQRRSPHEHKNRVEPRAIEKPIKDSGGVADGALAAAVALSGHRSTDGDGFVPAAAGKPLLGCEISGPCVYCDASEADEDYCADTGRRQEVRCYVRDDAEGIAGGDGDGQLGGAGVIDLPSSIRYQSCLHAEEDDLRGLLKFWLAMVLLGFTACFGIRKRQQKGASLYDRRAK